MTTATTTAAHSFHHMLRTMRAEAAAGARTVTGRLDNGVEVTLFTRRTRGGHNVVLSSEDAGQLDEYERAAQALGQTTSRWAYEADEDLPAEHYLGLR